MRPRVLVVDDDPEMRAILTEYVEKPFRVSDLIVQLSRLTARRHVGGARAAEPDSSTDG
jgi:CheY-like chemotaxis protein